MSSPRVCPHHDHQAFSYINGNPSLWCDKCRFWFWSDNRTEVLSERPCSRCKKLPTPEGHDACIANLPNIKFACCGHGMSVHENETYVVFNNDVVLRGEEARQHIKDIVNEPKNLPF